jgi:hypothetical protein
LERLLANGVWWVEVKRAVRHPIMHWAASSTENYPAQASTVLEKRNPGRGGVAVGMEKMSQI